MNEETEKKIVALLENIVTNQEIQLEKQAKSLAIQTKVIEMLELARADRIKEKTERAQKNAGKALIFVFVLIFILMLYLLFWML